MVKYQSFLQVLVQVHYAGINGGCETFRARGQYAFAGNADKEDFPLGAEGCGVVAAVGAGVTSLKVGDHAVILIAYTLFKLRENTAQPSGPQPSKPCSIQA